MGKRGPKRTPTKILRLRGSPLGDKRAKEGEIEPEPGEPVSPLALDDVAQACWDDVLSLLGPTGVITSADGYALAVLCQTWSRYCAVLDVLQEEGINYTIETDDGRVFKKEHPLLGRENQLLGRLKDQFARFGLTPADRSGLSIQKPARKDKLGAFKAS